MAIISTAHREGTGAYVVLEHLLRGWSGSRDELVVVTPLDSRVADAAAQLGYRVVPLRTPHDSFIWNARQMSACAKELAGCSVVHAWHSRGLELAWWLGRRLGVPACATMHDSPDCIEFSRLRHGLIRLVGRRLNTVVCVSNALQEEWGSARWAPRLVVIRNGLVDVPFEARPTRPVPVIGFLGMYASWKGFETACDWVAQMGDTTCKWLFYGHPRDMYRTAVMRLQQTYPDKVEFRGFQLSERIYREIDILINPSTQFDPLPTTLIEAARHGIPAVASDLGGAREIVEHEVTGYMFDVNRPIAGLCGLRELAKDESRRSAMGQAARRVFEERFGVARMAKEYARFWNGSLEGRGIESDRFGS